MARRALPSLAVLVVALACAVGLSLASCGRGGDDRFVGHAPPPIDTTTGTWLNTREPLAWKGLVGQVVYLQFGFLR